MLDLQQVQAEAPLELEGDLSRSAGQVSGVLDLVREISRGIHPAILSEQGLTLALKALARRSAVPVELDLRAGRRLPGQVEAAAYYAVSETLANAAKHARLRRARRTRCICRDPAAGDPRRRDWRR
jgi:signal transduction histidine kinase